MKLRSVSRRWVARGTVAAVAAVTLAAGLQAAATAAVHHGVSVSPSDPYSPAYHHAYRHGFVPTRGTAVTMRRWATAHPAAAQATAANDLNYGGAIDNIGVTTGPEQVYLVFYGSQWGTQGTDSNSDVTLSGDPSGEAPYLQELLKGLGTNGELWSGVMTQYCDWVATGAQSCPASNPLHVAYPTGGALAGVWADESAASPSTASGHQLGLEAVKAAGHFGNTTAASNRNAQYVILSPHGTNPDNWQTQGFCAWHDYNRDTTLTGGAASSPYGDIAFTNLPYQTDATPQGSCGANFVNPGSNGNLDGISIVEGHEYAETITDQNPAGGWTDSSGNENGDKCAWINPGTPGGSFNLSLATGTFAMQTTWANDGNGGQGACETSHAIVPDGSAHLIRVTNPGNQTSIVGTAVTGPQISAIDTASSETLSYSATGLPPGLSIASSSGAISGTPTATGTYSVTVTATDSVPVSGSATFSWRVGKQLLRNPGFESGVITPWTSTSGVLKPNGTYPAHSGNWLARLDGRSGTHTDTLSQKVSIAKTWTSATFQFYLQIRSNDPTTNAKAWDTLKVQVLSSSGTVLKTLATYSNKNTRNSYFKHSFSLNSYLGKTIILKFTGKETLTKHNTAFLVDDNALIAS